MKYLLLTLLLVTSYSQATFYDGKNETLFIIGSTSVAHLIKETKLPFFQKTGINLLVRPIGSQKGVTSIGERVSDIGMISRFLTSSEHEKYPDLSQVTIGQDAIVFVVNHSNAITNLSTKEIKALYTGNESMLDKTKEYYPDRLYSKAQGHGTLISFKRFFELDSMPAPLANNQLQFKNKGVSTLYRKTRIATFNQINQAVANVSRQPKAMAYESLGALTVFKKNNLTNNVKLLALDGVEPIVNNKVNHDYSLKRVINIVVSPDASEATKQYIEFLLSAEGQKIIADNSYIPL